MLLKKKKIKLIWGILVILLLGLAALLTSFWLIFIAIPSVELPVTIEISEGMTSVEVGQELVKQKIVFSATALHLALVLQNGENNIKAGSYYFNQLGDLRAWALARRLILGQYNLPDRWVTIYEGMNADDIAGQFDPEFFPKFNRETFKKLASEREGYLFPDSYRFAPNTTAEIVIKKMSDNFNEKLASLDFSQSTTFKTLAEILTFASIIEWEANNTDSDRKMIAGILWNRIQSDMPLQVDATLKYINGKTSDQLTMEDLQTEHDYNTYLNKGLPPTPINNPGLKTIEAAMYPGLTNNLYYLHDANGVPYYAETFEGHKINRAKTGV